LRGGGGWWEGCSPSAARIADRRDEESSPSRNQTRVVPLVGESDVCRFTRSFPLISTFSKLHEFKSELTPFRFSISVPRHQTPDNLCVLPRAGKRERRNSSIPRSLRFRRGWDTPRGTRESGRKPRSKRELAAIPFPFRRRPLRYLPGPTREKRHAGRRLPRRGTREEGRAWFP
jgi:hypothetical protein